MIQYQNLMQGNSSLKKRKRGTASERLEILEKDFTLNELFRFNNIEEVILTYFISVLCLDQD